MTLDQLPRRIYIDGQLTPENEIRNRRRKEIEPEPDEEYMPSKAKESTGVGRGGARAPRGKAKTPRGPTLAYGRRKEVAA